jgi:hypothetical protein
MFAAWMFISVLVGIMVSIVFYMVVVMSNYVVLFPLLIVIGSWLVVVKQINEKLELTER